MISKTVIAASVAALCATAPAPAQAASQFSAIYAFGDSLSDVGNVYLATGGAIPAFPYADGQFSNGPVWVQDLATMLGMSPLTPSLAGGTDYAFGGATAYYPPTITGVPNLAAQIASFGTVAPSNALYTFSIGANDLFDILGSGLPSLAAMEAAAVPVAAAVASAAAMLQSEGARNLILFDVPDLGVTPAFNSLGPIAAAATALSYYFDQKVLADLVPVENAGLTVYDLNIFALIDSAVANPGDYGFNNVTASCYVGLATGGGSVCATPETYLFWDAVHPTAAGHLLVAETAFAAVPEPGTWALLLLGFAGLGLAARRQSACAA